MSSAHSRVHVDVAVHKIESVANIPSASRYWDLELLCWLRAIALLAAFRRHHPDSTIARYMPVLAGFLTDQLRMEAVTRSRALRHRVRSFVPDELQPAERNFNQRRNMADQVARIGIRFADAIVID
jgi:succinylglutamate desuccinylase